MVGVDREGCAGTTSAEAPLPELFKLLNRAFMQDPYPALAELQRERAAVPIENGGFRMWVITRYEDVRTILADPSLKRDLVKHRHAVVGQNLIDIERRPKLPRELRRSMLDQDGADHLRLRRTVSRFFSPSRLAALRPRIEAAADGLLDRIPLGEPVDLVARYARPLAVDCLSQLLGVPQWARERFPGWETAILTAPSKPAVEQAGRELMAFALEVIALKRAQPAEDLFSELVADTADGLGQDETISMITLLLIAGLEPVTAIGSGVLALLGHPGQLAKLLADPESMSDCVDEILRYETPFRMLTPRYTDHPIELDGVTIPAGELLLVSTGAANRDPARFADPERFDVGRCPRGHLGFSHGAHRCLGAELGRLETSVGLERLFARFPHARLAVEPGRARWRTGIFMRRLEELPVVLG
jgi:cytochrome P450